MRFIADLLEEIGILTPSHSIRNSPESHPSVREYLSPPPGGEAAGHTRQKALVIGVVILEFASGDLPNNRA
jgi:hypothetical protein